MAKPAPKRKTTARDQRRSRKPQTPELVGRPRIPYDIQLGQLVLDEMAKGEESLRAICEKHGFPDRSVIFRWVMEEPEFAARYHEARDIQQHSHADDIIYLADKGKDLNRVRLQISTRQWHASRLLAKVYGDHINHDHTLVAAPTNTDILSRLLPGEREQLRALLEAAASRQMPGMSEGLVIEGRRG